MGRFYGLKVLEGNMEVGEVPKLWRAATERWLESYAEKQEGGK